MPPDTIQYNTTQNELAMDGQEIQNIIYTMGVRPEPIMLLELPIMLLRSKTSLLCPKLCF